MPRQLSNVLGIDDAPHGRNGTRVRLIGVVTARTRMDGLLMGHVRRDGRNATTQIATLLLESPFREHVNAILLQGITFGGFNAVDIHELHTLVRRPVLVVARRRPNLKRIEAALLAHVPGGVRKWQLIQRAGTPEPLRGVHVQRAGLSTEEAAALLDATTLHGHIPEPLRLAHLIAGGVVTGTSHGRT